jgi:hypothetical protein
MTVSVLSKWGDRPVYPQITRELIDALPDDQLAWAMHDHLWFRIGDETERTSQIVAELPAGYGVVYHLCALDGEVGNGGFNQYFFNGQDWAADVQIDALRRIGATRHMRIFRWAVRIHKQEKRNAELQRLYAQKTLVDFFASYEITRLIGCDDTWYALHSQFDALLAGYIRCHPELFVTE